MTRENSSMNAMNQNTAPETPENVIIDYGHGHVFDAARAVDDTVEWIRGFFDETGGKIAIIGISGGKDSSVAAALCARALGTENVIGVEMSNGGQADWREQDEIIERLGIHSIDFDIGGIVAAFKETAVDACVATPMYSICDNTVPEDMWGKGTCEKDPYNGDILKYKFPPTAETNLPARIRMCSLYLIAQSLNVSARVANTCNLSEDYIGWSTRYGDGAGDFSILSNYTATEIRAMGRILGLPAHLVEKPPADGLTDKTDEDNFGFTYEQLDAYIRLGDDANVPDEVRAKIDAMHKRNEFKMHMPPACENDLPVQAGENDNNVSNEEEKRRLLDALIANSANPFSNSILTKAAVPVHKTREDYSMDVTCSDGIDRSGLMVSCPNCKTSENLKIKADLACLNALEYWVECGGCGEHWTDRQLGLEYAEDEHELIEAWNEKMSGQV